MAFLLRVELPDVPGSLGALATALGTAGADIEAIEIIEHRADGMAVDDVLLELPPHVMPDALVTACHRLEGVRVQWVSRYNAGANLTMDLETVEAFTADPAHALERLVELVPATFRADWSVAVEVVAGAGEGAGAPGVRLLHASETAPPLEPECAAWAAVDRPMRLDPVPAWEQTLLAATPVRGRDVVVVLGRHGGPEVLESELARLGHLVSLAASVGAPTSR